MIRPDLQQCRSGASHSARVYIMNFLSIWVGRIGDALAAIAAACLLASALIITWMIIWRSSGGTNHWELETSIYLAVAAVFLGSPYTLRTGGHVGMDLLETTVSDRYRQWLLLSGAAVGISVCLFLTWYGARMTWHAFVSSERELGVFGPLLWPKYITMPIGMGLTALQYICQADQAIKELREPSNA